MKTSMSSQQRTLVILRINFSLTFLEGTWVLQQYVSQPSESESALLLGFSPLRLILLSLVFLLLVAILFLLIRSFSKTWPDSRTGLFFQKALENRQSFWILLLWAGLTYLALFASERYLDPFTSYRDRLIPILWWSACLALQAIASLIYIKSYGLNLVHEYRGVLLPALVALLSLGMFILLIAVTGLGLTPDPFYWQNAGVPILLTQVLCAWILGLVFHALITRSIPLRTARLDLWVSVGLWILASLLWLSQPSRPSYNSLPPRAPNFQTYPFGDSIIYDIAAHEYLIGTPIPSEFGVKPLYSLFLAFLHLFSGENYTFLISLQIIVLAAIPALVYVMISSLGERPAGFVAAILIVLRERNGIALSNVIEVSHAKLLMSDIFSMGLMILSLWLLFRWVEKPENRRASLLAVGGMIGLLSLTRGHPILLIPLMAIIILLNFRLQLRQRLQHVSLFGIGVIATLIPWFWRNYQMSGEFSFQDPVSRYTTYIAGLYSLTPGPPARLGGETDAEFYERLRGQMSRFILQHPGEVTRFVSAHQVHNMILSYVYLPHSFRIESLRSFVTMEPFWKNWRGDLQSQERVLLVLNICLIALGVGRIWKNRGALVLVPIVTGIGYIVSVSIGRISGWRFIQPSDWITLVFYSIGLMQISSMIRYLLTPSSQEIVEDPTPEFQENEIRPNEAVKVVATCLVFFAIALTLTHGHEFFAARYPAKSTGQLQEEYQRLTSSMPGSFLPDEVENFLRTENAMILYGEALYPAHFEAETGVFNHYLPSFKMRPYDRMVFHLLGHPSAGIIFPTKSVPSSFPDGAKVIVIGCTTEMGVLDAAQILMIGEPQILYTRDPLTGLSCPLPNAE